MAQTYIESRINERSQCRLCAQHEKTKYLFDIFGKEGAKHNLDMKIRKSLPIVVREDDGMPRWVCLDCINRLDMVAIFVESCMRSHHQFLNVLTNDPSKRIVAPPPASAEPEDEFAEIGMDEDAAITIKSEPHLGDDEIELNELPHVLRGRDNDPRISEVFSIDSEKSGDQVATVFIKAEPDVHIDEGQED